MRYESHLITWGCYISGDKRASMKSVLLLGALLLSASPVVADDFVYLECTTKTITTKKDLKSNQITKKVEEIETAQFTVDLANSRIKSAKQSRWEEAQIVDGAIVLDGEWTENGFTTSVKVSMQVVPPGRMMGDGLSRNDAILESFKARGKCKEIDESVFERTSREL